MHRLRLSVTLRCPGGVGQPPARLRGTMENASTGQMRSSNPPPACGAGCARVRKSRFGVWPHGKAQSGSVTLTKKRSLRRRCDRYVTKRRILDGRRHGKAQSVTMAHRKTHSATVVLPKSALCDTPLEVRSHRVRLSVRTETPTRDTLGACRLLKRTKQVIPAHTAIWP